MKTEKNLSTLKIHKLTQEQYDREKAAGTLDPEAIYLTPDDSDSIIADINEALTAAQQAIADLQANYTALQADVKLLTDIISYNKTTNTVTFS